MIFEFATKRDIKRQKGAAYEHSHLRPLFELQPDGAVDRRSAEGML